MSHAIITGAIRQCTVLITVIPKLDTCTKTIRDCATRPTVLAIIYCYQPHPDFEYVINQLLTEFRFRVKGESMTPRKNTFERKSWFSTYELE